MPTMLLTGGAGFIGTKIADAARAHGWAVRIIDSLRADVHGDNASAPTSPNFFHADVTDIHAVSEALRDVDLVCHQAAKVGLGVNLDDAPDYAFSNVVGTATLLAAMRAQHVSRLVLASSMVVYGEGAYRVPQTAHTVRPAPRRVSDLEVGNFEPRDPATQKFLIPDLVDEDAPVDPRNVYATTKLAQENLASAWARETGGRAAMLRYHNVYGPGMPRNTPYAGVASLFRSALERGESPRVFEDGAQRRDFVHVRDVASANLSAATWTDNTADGTARAFNVGSGTVTTIGAMAQQLSEEFGDVKPITTGEFRLGDVRHITASSQRAAQELGWSAKIGFAEGVREFATAPLRA